ncbi:MAG: O-acetylhomoserine aminocarboxypropyltransferase [Neorhizobium sp.]|nr:O-acetylhomoserine aminocarboxypropyltransferase [Neorhizobium sp.]
MPNKKPGFSTLAVHAGAAPDATTGARTTPIYQTASFVFADADHAAALFGLREFGNVYTRITNPTQAVLEERVAALEGGTAALAVASGQAAQMLVFHILMSPGDNFIAAHQLYGGSINQFGHAFGNFGWNVRWADAADPGSFEEQIDGRTRAIFVESLTNPAGLFTDIEAIAAIAHRHGLPFIVDNTLATPYLLRPLEHGADIVVHSLTKFLGGHGNSVGGIIVDGGTFDWSRSGNYPMLSEPRPEYDGIVLHQAFGNTALAVAVRALGLRDLGPSISPFNAFQILTGIETLPLRMQRHSDNALAVATWLRKQKQVAWVNYSGLHDHPNHALQRRYSPKGAGAVFTFGLQVTNGMAAAVVAGTTDETSAAVAAGRLFVEGLQLISHLANIGDTRSLVTHPASTTHRQLTLDQQIAAGAGPEVVRLSIGIEDPDDLIEDIRQALEKI